MSPRQKKFIWFLGGIFFISGCAYPPVRVEKEILPGQIIERMNARRLEVQSFQGRAQLEVKWNEARYVLPEMIYYQKPDRLRLETLGFLGLPITILTYDQQEVFFYLPLYRQGYQGRVSLEEFLSPELKKLGWKGEDFLEGLFSQTLLASGYQIVSLEKLSSRGKEGNYLLEMVYLPEGYKQKIQVKVPPYIILRNEIYDQKENLVMVWESSDWIEEGGKWFARKTVLDWKKENLRLAFSYQSWKINPIFSSRIFEIQLSSGEEIITLEKIPNLLEFLGGQW